MADDRHGFRSARGDLVPFAGQGAVRHRTRRVGNRIPTDLRRKHVGHHDVIRGTRAVVGDRDREAQLVAGIHRILIARLDDRQVRAVDLNRIGRFAVRAVFLSRGRQVRSVDRRGVGNKPAVFGVGCTGDGHRCLAAGRDLVPFTSELAVRDRAVRLIRHIPGDAARQRVEHDHVVGGAKTVVGDLDREANLVAGVDRIGERRLLDQQIRAEHHDAVGRAQVRSDPEIRIFFHHGQVRCIHRRRVLDRAAVGRIGRAADGHDFRATGRDLVPFTGQRAVSHRTRRVGHRIPVNVRRENVGHHDVVRRALTVVRDRDREADLVTGVHRVLVGDLLDPQIRAEDDDAVGRAQRIEFAVLIGWNNATREIPGINGGRIFDRTAVGRIGRAGDVDDFRGTGGDLVPFAGERAVIH